MTNLNKYPVVLFLYKRPESTQTILDLIVRVGIKKVYIFLDGPKTESDKHLSNQVKKVVKSFIASHSSVEFIPHYSSSNKGLKKSIVTGLNQVFRVEDAAIILEDDCIPAMDFFKFMQSMLAKYHDTKEILSVAGTSVGRFSPYSYDFSRYQLCWGWATWKRSWLLYDERLNGYQDAKIDYISNISLWYWRAIFDLVRKNIIDTWDYQWSYVHFATHGLSVVPSVNLVTNIGFDDQATNTKSKSSVAGMMVAELSWPLIHPKEVSENLDLTKAIDHKFYHHLVPFLGLARYYLYILLGLIHAKKV